MISCIGRIYVVEYRMNILKEESNEEGERSVDVFREFLKHRGRSVLVTLKFSELKEVCHILEVLLSILGEVLT